MGGRGVSKVWSTADMKWERSWVDFDWVVFDWVGFYFFIYEYELMDGGGK
mgnify:FL=1